MTSRPRAIGQLISALNGREITRLDGTKQTLHLAGARIQRIEPTLRENLLGWLVNPNVALLLLVGGALLIYLEFNTPGTIVPGALGTLMVLLAIFALNLLPIRYTAVMLLLAAAVLLVLEAKFGGHGALAIAGIVCLTLGTLTLVAAPIPELAVKPWVAIAREYGIWGNHGVSGAPGGEGATVEGTPGRGCAGGPSRLGDGTADSRGPRSGGWRDLAGGCERGGPGGNSAAGRGPRAVPVESVARGAMPAGPPLRAIEPVRCRVSAAHAGVQSVLNIPKRGKGHVCSRSAHSDS